MACQMQGITVKKACKPPSAKAFSSVADLLLLIQPCRAQGRGAQEKDTRSKSQRHRIAAYECPLSKTGPKTLLVRASGAEFERVFWVHMLSLDSLDKAKRLNIVSVPRQFYHMKIPHVLKERTSNMSVLQEHNISRLHLAPSTRQGFFAVTGTAIVALVALIFIRLVLRNRGGMGAVLERVSGSMVGVFKQSGFIMLHIPSFRLQIAGHLSTL